MWEEGQKYVERERERERERDLPTFYCEQMENWRCQLTLPLENNKRRDPTQQYKYVASGMAVDRATPTLMFLAACWLSSFEGTRTKALTAATALAEEWATLDDLS